MPLNVISCSYDMFTMLIVLFFCIDSWLQFTMHTNIIIFFKISYLYFVEKSSQMTHFSCNIPYTAQVYSGKPREGQYSRHHNIKEGNETKFNYSRETMNSRPVNTVKHLFSLELHNFQFPVASISHQWQTRHTDMLSPP